MPVPSIASSADTALRDRRVTPVVLIVCTVAAFAYAIACDFTSWDDPYNIWQNPRLNPPTLEGIAEYWRHAAYGLYIPLTYTVWGLLALVARVSPDPQGVALNPYVFHAANVAIHVLSVLATFKILQRLIGDRRSACIGAMLFALHPVQVEAVAWAAGMKDVLSGMLALVAIWQYIQYVGCTPPDAGSTKAGVRNPKQAEEEGNNAPKQARSGRGGRWRLSSVYYLIAIVTFLAAMLAKPSALVVPAIVFAIDLWLFRRPLKQVLKALAPWMLLAALCAYVGSRAQPAIGVIPAPIWARPLIAGDALAFYLYKLVWPIEFAIDYGRRPIAVIGQWWFYLTWIIPAAIAALLWIGRRPFPMLLVSGIIFIAGVAPVLGLVTFLFQHYSTVADHYLYLSMLGPALAAASVVQRLGSARLAVIGAAACALALLGIRTALQVRIWKDDFTLFAHALEVNPRSFMAMNNLGRAQRLAPDGDLDRAEELFRRALAIHPDYWEAHENLGGVLKAKGHLNEAIRERQIAMEILLRRPAELQGDLLTVASSLGADLMDAGRLKEARGYFQTVLRFRPDDVEASRNLTLIEQRLHSGTTRPAGAS